MQPPAGIRMVANGVSPGSTKNLTVQEPEVDLIVKNGSSQIAPAHVKFSFASTSGPSSTDSWVPTIAANAATNPKGALPNLGQPFASTTANVSASGYTGQITVCVDNGTRYKTAPVNDSYSAATTVTIDMSTGTT